MISIFNFSLLSTKFFKIMDWFLYDSDLSHERVRILSEVNKVDSR